MQRRTLQFSLRSLLCFVLITSIPFWFLGGRLAKARHQRYVVSEIKKLGGFIAYDVEHEAVNAALESGASWIETVPEEVGWDTRLFGYDFDHRVAGVYFPRSIRKNRQRYENSCLSDADLKWLVELADLREVALVCHSITDGGLQSLRGLTHLRSLDLHGTNISDAGLRHLADLKELKSLDVGRTRVSFAEVASTFGCSGLKEISFSTDQIEAAGGWAAVNAALPRIKIREVYQNGYGAYSVRP